MSEHKVLEFAGENKEQATAELVNFKARKWQEHLATNNITCFGTQIVGDELHTVLFRTVLDVNGQELPIIIFTDDSAFTVIKVLVTPGAVNDSNKIAVLESINEMNRSYKLFKYLVSEKDIELECCNLSRDDFFDPQVIHISLDIILEHLQKEYPKLMQMIWGSAGSVDQ